MRSLVHLGLLSALVATAPACTPAARPDQTAVRDSVAAGAQRFTDAVKAMDATAVAGLYAEDATLMPPNAEPVTGRIAIKDFWAAAMSAGVREVQLEIREVFGADSLAVEVGGYTILGPGGASADRGKYLVVWKRHGSQWQLYRDIWNSSIPAVTEAIPAR